MRYQWKILLRYRSTWVFSLAIVGIIVFLRYFTRMSMIHIKTVIPVVFLCIVFMSDLFTNLFEMENRELWKYQQFPLSITKLIYDKNRSVILLTLLLVSACSTIGIVLFQLTIEAFFHSITYYFVVVFLLVGLGNVFSVVVFKYSSPNYSLIRMGISVILVSFLSLPYVLIKLLTQTSVFCYPYIFGAFLFWRYGSILFAAKRLSKNMFKLLELAQ
jgi:hypothetical protein